MAKWLILSAVIAGGVCLSAGGLLYGVLAVGVPAPDAPPEVAAQEHRDASRAGTAMAAGLAVSALGGAGLAAAALTRLVGRRTSDAGQGAAADRPRD